jgi:hypothetical protein
MSKRPFPVDINSDQQAKSGRFAKELADFKKSEESEASDDTDGPLIEDRFME